MQGRITTGAAKALASFRRCRAGSRTGVRVGELGAAYVEWAAHVGGDGGGCGVIRSAVADRAPCADGGPLRDFSLHRSRSGRSAPRIAWRRWSVHPTVAEAATAWSGILGRVAVRRRAWFVRQARVHRSRGPRLAPGARATPQGAQLAPRAWRATAQAAQGMWSGRRAREIVQAMQAARSAARALVAQVRREEWAAQGGKAATSRMGGGEASSWYSRSSASWIS